jgi:creatinine amidohydrolase/Fe(II)-dependent formamide hydrolase-like protein
MGAALAGALLVAVPLAVRAAPPDTVFLEELTWTEVRDLVRAGKTTIILPTGGTEQNGPHLVLGKHNDIVRYTSERIARALGNALVAPVMKYVPEGNVDPPTGHMAYPGTISMPEEVFEKMVEYAARSFRASGFRDIVFIGDSGPNQKGMKAVADRLNKAWKGKGTRIHYSPGYYTVGYSMDGGFARWLRSRGETPETIGQHGGIPDTSQLLAIDPRLVRTEKLAPGGDRKATGVDGHPERASAEYGRKGLDMKVETAVAEIRASMAKK